MLDVHAPHERMEGVRDFLLHLLTITVGLLIALSLEGLVEWRHRVHLVEQARATLHAELVSNNRALHQALLEIAKEQATVDADLATLKRIQNNPEDKREQQSSLSDTFNFTDLRDTAWKTAQASGALSYMPYEEAQRYAGVYGSNTAFEASQQKIAGDLAAFFGVITKNNLSDDRPVTYTAASELAERCGIWKGDLVFLALRARMAAAEDATLLAGKPAPEGFHEEMK